MICMVNLLLQNFTGCCFVQLKIRVSCSIKNETNTNTTNNNNSRIRVSCSIKNETNTNTTNTTNNNNINNNNYNNKHYYNNKKSLQDLNLNINVTITTTGTKTSVGSVKNVNWNDLYGKSFASKCPFEVLWWRVVVWWLSVLYFLGLGSGSYQNWYSYLPKGGWFYEVVGVDDYVVCTRNNINAAIYYVIRFLH